jgi:ribonucleoside-diphosphate reductase alpha chain
MMKEALSRAMPLHEFPADEIYSAIHNLDVMPSMRALMTAGEALDRDHGAAYNCGYTPIESIKDFADLMHLLMNGTGGGFSVERQYTNQLPEVPQTITETDTCITVRDSKGGWCESYLEYLTLLFAGEFPTYDTSAVRPAGARLRTFGGRASGPQPLIDLFEFTKTIVRNAQGRKLSSSECHEICCKIADIVVVGGVRRSALISLSNLSDPRMRDIKKGDLSTRKHLYLSNNSVCYTEKPDLAIYLEEMHSLFESHSGERGVFNRQAAKNIAERSGRRDVNWDFGTNPCSEIILRPRQFCNLSEVVCRPTDTFEDLKEKVRIATILGTLQSTLTDFKFLDPRWKENTEEERLLGVSLTGIMDHPTLNGSSLFKDEEAGDNCWLPLEVVLKDLKQVSIDTNKEWAKKLNIPQSKAITCVKPSGTVSQLVDSASGIHDRFSPFYIRRVKGDIKDPLTSRMIELGIPHEASVTKPESEVVFTFPKKAPEGSAYLSAEDKLAQWLVYQDHWCEHKPSVTINYTDDEYLPLISTIYKNFDTISGISLLPKDDHVYVQAPYEAIDEDTYNELLSRVPEYGESLADLLKGHEQYDTTEGVQQLACVAGVCDI